MAKTNTMVLVFGFSFSLFLPVSKEKVLLVFGFCFCLREGVGILPPLSYNTPPQNVLRKTNSDVYGGHFLRKALKAWGWGMVSPLSTELIPLMPLEVGGAQTGTKTNGYQNALFKKSTRLAILKPIRFDTLLGAADEERDNKQKKKRERSGQEGIRENLLLSKCRSFSPRRSAKFSLNLWLVGIH